MGQHERFAPDFQDRRIVENTVDLRRGLWKKKEYGRARGLKGRTLGIVGLGQIGGALRMQRTSGGVELDFVAPIRSRLFGSPAAQWSSPVRPAARQRAKGTRRSSRQPRESRFRIRGDDEYDWHGSVGIHRATIERFADNMSTGQWDPPDVFDLRLHGERLSAVPLSGSSNVARIFMSVVLPAPFGPSSPNIPRGISRLTCLRA